MNVRAAVVTTCHIGEARHKELRQKLQFHNCWCSPCFSVPPGYVYPSPYLTAAPSGIVPLPPAPVSHAAALAAAAAATSQFYEYQNAAAAAAATYPGQYPNGFETYPYSATAGKPSCYVPSIGDTTGDYPSKAWACVARCGECSV